MNGASFFVVGDFQNLGNRGCLSGLCRDFSRDSNVCGGMNGAAACFAACLAQKRDFERRNERRRRMFCRMFGTKTGF